MHEQLIQLLEKHFGSVDTVPPQLRALLESINESYQSRDKAEAEREEAQKINFVTSALFQLRSICLHQNVLHLQV